MSEQWYYAQNGQQLGPVSHEVFLRLAGAGQIQPADLVWREGMANWAPARTVRGAFPEPAPAPIPMPVAALVPPATGAAPYGLSPDPLVAPTPGPPEPFDRRGGPPPEDYWDRPRPRPRSSGNTALIVGGIVGGAVLVIGAVVLLIVLLQPGNSRSFSLRTNEKFTHEVEFKKGQKVQIWVTSDYDSDVDLFVYEPGNPRPVAWDDGPSQNCRAGFTAQSTQRYQIVVWNRMLDPRVGQNHRNRHNSGTLKWEAK